MSGLKVPRGYPRVWRRRGFNGRGPHPKKRERLREERSQPPPPGEDEKKKRFWLLACFLGNPGTAQDPTGESPLFANLADKGRQMPTHTPPHHQHGGADVSPVPPASWFFIFWSKPGLSYLLSCPVSAKI